MSERFFLDTDSDGHWYVVPYSRATEWHEWTSIPDGDERGWNAPDFAKAVGGAPSLVTFSNPEIA